MTDSLSQIQDNAVAALKRWLNGPEDRKTENLRTTAGCFVSAREHFLTPAGEPDWLGRSHAYRHWVRETMTRAGVPADRTSGTLTSIRYHAGNALRERLDEATLSDLGLLSTSPLKRAQAHNADKSEMLKVLDGGRVTSPRLALGALETVASILRRIDLPSIDGADEEERQAIRAVARAVAITASSIERVAAHETMTEFIGPSITIDSFGNTVE